MKPIVVLIDGKELEGWTSLKLDRDLHALTGSVTIEIFFTLLPTAPILREAKAGREVQVYIGGTIAFNGKLDARHAKGEAAGHRNAKGRLHGKNGKYVSEGGASKDGGGSVSSNISATAYTVTLTARGKTKKLVDSSHDSKKGMLKDVSIKETVDHLTKNFNVKVLDESDDSDKVERVVFRDGATVANEVHRWTRASNILAFETRNGDLKLAKYGAGVKGDDLILGENILEFSSEQSEDQGNSSVTVKGQRTDPKIHGKEAVLKKLTITDDSIKNYSPLTVQVVGDATTVRIKKRAKLEADRRAQESKKITIVVFGVTQNNGEAWDLNNLHYVEIPPEGIFDQFVVRNISVDVSKDTYKTTLTLSPPSAKEDGSKDNSDNAAKGAARRAQSGLKTSENTYPSDWANGSITFSDEAPEAPSVTQTQEAPNRLPGSQNK